MNASGTLNQAERVHIANRWLEYEGELRAALVRVVLLVCFYSVQLFHYLVLSGRGEVEQNFHRHVTYISAIWLLLSLVVLTALTRYWMPRGLKYCITGADVLLLVLMALGGGGATSSLVLVLPLVVLLSGLRCSLPLIWFSTVSSLIGYGGLGYASALMGRASPRTIDQMVALVVIAATGVAVGQLVRMMRSVLIERLSAQSVETGAVPAAEVRI